MLGPVPPGAPSAQLHRPWQVVAEQHLGAPLHPGSLQDQEDPAALPQWQHSDLQTPHSDLLQVQEVPASPQPVGGQGGPEEATHQEAAVSRPQQEDHAFG